MWEVVVDGLIYHHQSVGGVSRIYHELLPRLCDQDESLQVLLFTIGARQQQPLPQHPRIEYRLLPRAERYLRPSILWGYAMPAVSYLRQRIWLGPSRGRLWHSTYYTLPVAWDGPKTLTVYDMVHERCPQIYSGSGDRRFTQWKARCVRAADAVIAISETTKRDLLDFVPVDEAKVHVAPLGVSHAFRLMDTISPAAATGRGRDPAVPFLLYVGARDRRKNFWGMLEAYASWRGNRDLQFIAAGGGEWTDQERCRLVELHVADRVSVEPRVDDRALAVLYNRAAALVHPSVYEGFGLTVLEALACGCPVVASRIPATLEVAVDCAIYFEPTDPLSLGSALDQALTEGRASARTSAGIGQAQLFSWDRTARAALKLFRELT